ncbi:hypothetical protein IWX49DRAFT_595537 [Phyllosticta citricarpa]|uniref:Carbohydrate esterase family 16 protein n=2 Tax=Phyllosticta TaxID=121621 RepID=A0ABR1L3A3_9PEZI
MKALKYLFIIGDSFSWTYFNLDGPKPSLENPLGNPNWPGVTTAGGANWVGHLISKYNATDILTYNFADGGATVNCSLVEPRMPYPDRVRCANDQVKQFRDELATTPRPPHANWTSENALVAIWIGLNDLGNDWHRFPKRLDEHGWMDQLLHQYHYRRDLMHEVLKQKFEQVDLLYKEGVRNFAFFTLPPLQYTPAMRAQSDDLLGRGLMHAILSEYNKLLARRVARYHAETHKLGVKSVLVDVRPAFRIPLQNPAGFGAVDDSCFNWDGWSCLWANDYHPGQAINDLMARSFALSWGQEDGFFTNPV